MRKLFFRILIFLYFNYTGAQKGMGRNFRKIHTIKESCEFFQIIFVQKHKKIDESQAS